MRGDFEMSNESMPPMSQIQNLLMQRERAIELIEVEHSASGTPISKSLKRLITKLNRTANPSELIQSPELLTFVPLLGALDRNDVTQTKNALQLVLRSTAEKDKTYRFRPSYSYIIGLICFAIFTFQAFYLAPIFEEMFNDFRLRLAWPTKLVLDASWLVRNYSPVLIILAIIHYFLWEARSDYRNYVFNLLSRIPVVGSFFSGTRNSLQLAANQTLILAELLEQNLPTSLAILLSQGRLPKHAPINFKNDLEPPLEVPTVSLPKRVYLPASVLSTLRTPASPSNQTNHLRKLSQIYADRLQMTGVENTPILWIQSSVLLLGILVMLLVLSLFMPLISLVSSLS